MSKKLYPLVLAVAVLLAAALAGCGKTESPAGNGTAQPSPSSAADSGEKTVKHVWGETKVKGIPANIVTLDFSFLDMLASIGAQPVGGASNNKVVVPEYMKDKVSGEVKDIGDRREPNLEVIRSLKPDLIIANPDRHKAIKNELEAIAPTIALDDTSYETILTNTELLADLLGKKEKATAVKKELDAKLADAKSKLTGKPSVMVGGAFEDDWSIWVKDSFVGTLMNAAGVNYTFTGNIDGGIGKGEVAKLSTERLAESNPDYLFVYGEYAKWKDNTLLKNMKAAKENHILEVDRNLWSRGRGPIAAGKILDEALPVLSGAESK